MIRHLPANVYIIRYFSTDSVTYNCQNVQTYFHTIYIEFENSLWYTQGQNPHKTKYKTKIKRKKSVVRAYKQCRIFHVLLSWF